MLVPAMNMHVAKDTHFGEREHKKLWYASGRDCGAFRPAANPGAGRQNAFSRVPPERINPLPRYLRANRPHYSADEVWPAAV
jgi:hypothetical protein